MSRKNSLAVKKTWRNRETRRKRVRSLRIAAKDPERIKAAVKAVRLDREQNPEKYELAMEKSLETRKKHYGLWLSNLRKSQKKRRGKPHHFKDPVARGRSISASLQALYASKEGDRLRKLASETMTRNWENEEYVEIVSAASSKAHTGRKQSMEEVEKRTAAILKLYRDGKHPGAGPNGWHRRDYKNVVLSSSYELAFAKWCDRYGIKWEYQPKRFTLVENGTYRPDFHLPKYNFWIEVKGAMMPGPMNKFIEFQKLFPDCPIALLDQDLLKEILDHDLLVEAKILKR